MVVRLPLQSVAEASAAAVEAMILLPWFFGPTIGALFFGSTDGGTNASTAGSGGFVRRCKNSNCSSSGLRPTIGPLILRPTDGGTNASTAGCGGFRRRCKGSNGSSSGRCGSSSGLFHLWSIKNNDITAPIIIYSIFGYAF